MTPQCPWSAYGHLHVAHGPQTGGARAPDTARPPTLHADIGDDDQVGERTFQLTNRDSSRAFRVGRCRRERILVLAGRDDPEHDDGAQA